MYRRLFCSCSGMPSKTRALSLLATHAASKATRRPLPSCLNLGYTYMAVAWKCKTSGPNVGKIWLHTQNLSAKILVSESFFCLSIAGRSLGLRFILRLGWLLCLRGVLLLVLCTFLRGLFRRAFGRFFICLFRRSFLVTLLSSRCFIFIRLECS